MIGIDTKNNICLPTVLQDHLLLLAIYGKVIYFHLEMTIRQFDKCDTCWPLGNLLLQNYLLVQKKKSEDIVPFCVATDTPVMEFCWCLPLVSKPVWISHLHASWHACRRFLRFTSGATPVDLLATFLCFGHFSDARESDLTKHVLCFSNCQPNNSAPR